MLSASLGSALKMAPAKISAARGFETAARKKLFRRNISCHTHTHTHTNTHTHKHTHTHSAAAFQTSLHRYDATNCFGAASAVSDSSEDDNWFDCEEVKNEDEASGAFGLKENRWSVDHSL